LIIQFGEWLPDQPRYQNKCVTATNVYPSATGYLPFKGIASVTTALPSTPIGVYSFKRVAGNIETFAGTSTGLYRKNGSSWTDVSGTTYSPSTQWRFAIYGDRVVATNGVDNPQAFDLGTDSVFADLPNAPTHKFPLVVRDTLVALDLTDGSGNEVAWSVTNNSEDWTVANGGGAQNFPDGGKVVGGTGGEYGVILQSGGVTRMNFVGGDLRFTFDQIEGDVGCIASNSIVRHKGITYFLSDEGFQAFNGAESFNISDEKVSRYFFGLLSEAEALVTDTGEEIITMSGEVITVGALNEVYGALDQRNSCIVWSYPTATGNKLLIYNYKLDKWSESKQSIDLLYTAEDVAGPVLAGFDSSFLLNTFSGSDLTAVVSTGDMQLNQNGGTYVNYVRGLCDAAHDVTVGKKTTLSDTETTATGSSNANGKVSLRSSGRYQRFQLSPTAAFTELSGVDVGIGANGNRV